MSYENKFEMVKVLNFERKPVLNAEFVFIIILI